MFECNYCKQQVKQLVIPADKKILACRSCAYPEGAPRPTYNVNLGQTVEKWTHIDKKTGNEIKHKVTTGKQWEIEHRRLSGDDGHTVVNYATGKPAQY